MSRTGASKSNTATKIFALLGILVIISMLLFSVVNQGPVAP